jgi:hypothetical protein
MGFGADLSGLEDFEIASVISRASAMVNAYCAAPNWPQPHSYAGGSAASEQHKWTLGTEITRGERRVYPYHWPIKAVSDFKIKVTNQTYASIGVTDLYINNSDRYVEVVSLAAVAHGVLPVGVVPNLGLYQPVAEVTYTYGYEFPVTGETIYATDGLTYRAANGFWKTGTVKPYIGGVEQTTGFTLDLTEGTVTFTTPPTGAVTLDYTFTLPWEIAQATGEITTQVLTDRELTGKGMRGLATIQIAEVQLKRAFDQGNMVSDQLTKPIPDSAAALLEGFRFRSIR